MQPSETGPASLQPRKSEDRGGVSLPLAAMAEALRANAEALRRIDTNQGRIAESLEKSDRAQNVVTSTRALNETFRGLSEIQRGLLDAVVGGRSRGRGLPFAFAAVTVLAAALGFLVYERMASRDTVSRELYETARRESAELSRELGALRAGRVEDAGEQSRAREALAERDRRLEALERERTEQAERAAGLAAELETMESRVSNYLAVKELADQAGALQVANMRLEQEKRDLASRLDHAEAERRRLLDLAAQLKLDSMGGDPEAIMAAARARGVIPEPEPAPTPDGPFLLSKRSSKYLLTPLNRLLDGGEGDSYVIVGAAAVRDGTTLLDVQVAAYRNATMVNSLQAKTLDILVDAEKQTVELRLAEGSIVNTTGESIPFAESGHSVFLKGIPVAEWLRRVTSLFGVAPDGRLTWKHQPS